MSAARVDAVADVADDDENEDGAKEPAAAAAVDGLLLPGVERKERPRPPVRPSPP
jgi:hypothetical protein